MTLYGNDADGKYEIKCAWNLSNENNGVYFVQNCNVEYEEDVSEKYIKYELKFAIDTSGKILSMQNSYKYYTKDMNLSSSELDKATDIRYE